MLDDLKLEPRHGNLLPEDAYEEIVQTREERAAFHMEKASRMSTEEKNGPRPWDEKVRLIRDLRKNQRELFGHGRGL